MNLQEYNKRTGEELLKLHIALAKENWIENEINPPLATMANLLHQVDPEFQEQAKLIDDKSWILFRYLTDIHQPETMQ